MEPLAKHQTILDVNQALNRNDDVWDSPMYPKDVDEAVAFNLREDRTTIPRYQPRPGPLFYMMNAVEELSDEQLASAEKAFGMDEPRYGVVPAVHGLNNSRGWGANLFYSCLIMAKSFNRERALAKDLHDAQWHYHFEPGTLELGRTGRVLENGKGERFDEALSVIIAPDLVYSALMNGGFYVDGLEMVLKDRSTRVVVEHGKKVPGQFPKHRTSRRFRDEPHLIKLPSVPGMSVLLHPFDTAGLEDLFVFQTGLKYESIKELADTAAAATDHIAWKLASLQEQNGDGDMNNFLQTGHWRLYEWPIMFPRWAHLGSTGRAIRTANNKGEDGREWPSNYQAEYISFDVTREMVISAIRELPDLKKIVGTRGKYDEPWEIVYEDDGDATPQHSKILEQQSKRLEQNTIPPQELTELLMPLGLPPESNAN